MKVRSVFLVFGLLLASRPGGAADAGPLSLQWHAAPPTTCPTGAEVEAEVLRLAGTEPRVTQSLDAEATAAIGEDGKWTLTLLTRLGGVPGERVLRGNSCREVADAGVLVLALTLNPELERGRPAQSERVVLSRGASAEPAPSSDEARFTLDTQAQLGIRMGSLPRAAAAIEAGLGTRFERVGVWAFASYSPRQRAASVDRPTAGGQLSLLAVTGVGCWSFLAESIEFGPCAGVEAARIGGDGYGVSNSRHAQISWVSAVFAGKVTWRLRRMLRLRLESSMLAPLRRPSLRLDGVGPVHQPEIVAFQMGWGLELQVL